MATPSPLTHRGAEYFRRISSLESDRRTRAAFQRLVLDIAPPGAALFDFGAGPGIDANFFAQRGYPLRAYDADPVMREFFDQLCGEFIVSGRVELERGDYHEFLNRPPPAQPVDLVLSNFAPLNLIGDLHELFAKFHSITVPNGKVVASVLNPFFLEDMKTARWWRNAVRLWRDGHYTMPGPQAPHIRRRPADFGRSSAPYFELAHIYRPQGSQPAAIRGGSVFVFCCSKSAQPAPARREPTGHHENIRHHPRIQ